MTPVHRSDRGDFPGDPPGKILCVGFNYRRHAAELDYELPAEPLVFMKPRTALVGDGDEVVYPGSIQRLDFEGELVAVVGKLARHVPTREALDFLAGYTVGNDFTARDLQHPDGQWTFAKGFDTFCSLGPRLIPLDDWRQCRLVTTVNGEMRQDASVGDLLFGVPELVSYISARMTLEPGDVIMTGTPPGVGPLQVGDEVAVTIEPIGTLRNRIIAEKPHRGETTDAPA